MNKKEITAVILNGILIVLGIIGMIRVVDHYHASAIIYYTVDSNIVCLISSILFFIFMLIKKNITEIPFFVMALRFIATVCLIVTFIVVVAYIAPAKLWVPNGTYLDNLKVVLLRDDMLYQHLLCPVICFISFSFFEGDRRLNKKKTIWYGVIATLVYGITMIVLNLLKIVDGPYPFFKVNEDPVVYSLVMIAIILMSYLFGRFVLLLNQKYSVRRIKKAK